MKTDDEHEEGNATDPSSPPIVPTPRYESPSELRGFGMSPTGTALGVGGQTPGARSDPIFFPDAEPEISPEELDAIQEMVGEFDRGVAAHRGSARTEAAPPSTRGPERSGRVVHEVGSVPTTQDAIADEPVRTRRPSARPPLVKWVSLAGVAVASVVAIGFALNRSTSRDEGDGGAAMRATAVPTAPTSFGASAATDAGAKISIASDDQVAPSAAPNESDRERAPTNTKRTPPIAAKPPVPSALPSPMTPTAASAKPHSDMLDKF